MIQVTRADDLERRALRLEIEARELEAAGEDRAAERAESEAMGLRQLATRLRQGRPPVRFG